jgi:hypothetical protein
MSHLYNINDSIDYQFKSTYKYTEKPYYAKRMLEPHQTIEVLRGKPNYKDYPINSYACGNLVFPIYNDKLPEVEEIPIIDDAVFKNEEHKDRLEASVVLGPFNEIEYSTNVRFIDPNIKCPKESPDYIKSIFRTYFKKRLNLYTNDKHDILSTKYNVEKNLIHPIETDLFLRIDEKVSPDEIGGSMVNNCENIERITYGSEEDKKITAKLKVLKQQFNHKRRSYTLMGAIETSLKDLETYPILGPGSIKHNPFKRLHIVSWRVIGIYVMDNNATRCFKFRISFRRTMIAKNNKKQIDTNSFKEIDCNIECEDRIPGKAFAECTDALIKYYRSMYYHQNRYVSPLFERTKFKNTSLKTNLTDEQFEFLESLSVLDESSDVRYELHGEGYDLMKSKRYGIISSSLKEFIRLSAIRLYLESIDDKSKASIRTNPPNEELITRITDDNKKTDEKEEKSNVTDDNDVKEREEETKNEEPLPKRQRIQ